MNNGNARPEARGPKGREWGWSSWPGGSEGGAPPPYQLEGLGSAVMTNRKSHTPFRLVPKSTTLDDLEWPIHTLLQKRHVFRTQHENLNEDRPILSEAKKLANDSSFWRYKDYTDIRGGSLGKRCRTTAALSRRGSRTAIFSVFAGYIFGNFRDEARVII